MAFRWCIPNSKFFLFHLVLERKRKAHFFRVNISNTIRDMGEKYFTPENTITPLSPPFKTKTITKTQRVVF